MDAKLAAQLNKYGINLADASERMDDNLELFHMLAMKYLNNPNFADLKAALEVDDFEAAFQASHALKGVAGNLSFTNLYKSASALCNALRVGESDIAQCIFPEVETDHNKVVDGLLAWENNQL